MEEQLDILIHEFTAVKENINSINKNISSVKTKLDKMRSVYSKMISTNSHKKIFLFCLESFNFQIKSFSVDSDNLQKSLLLVSNRVYCDYYKLFKLIKILFDDYGYHVPKEIGNLHTYDILNPFFEYLVPDIDKIHGDVCLLINALIEYYNDNCTKIANYTSKSQTGISIFNFIKTLEYDNSVLKDQIVLYLNYMDFFKITQTKYLAKLVGKTDSLKKEIDDEIVDDLEPTVEEPIELTVETSNPPNTPVVSSDDEEDGPYLDLTSPTRISDSLSETSEISLTDSKSSKSSSSEKKNEISTPENVEEKPAKKKGRPRTKGVAKTKNAKKDEATDSKGRSAPNTFEGRGAPDTFEESQESQESFGLTIDQIEEHVAMNIVE